MPRWIQWHEMKEKKISQELKLEVPKKKDIFKKKTVCYKTLRLTKI